MSLTKNIFTNQLYKDLVEPSTFNQAFDIVKNNYRESLDKEAYNTIIEIIKEAIVQLKALQERQKIISLYELFLEILVSRQQKKDEIRILFEFLEYLGKIVVSESFLKVIQLTEEYLLQPLEVSYRISLLNSFIRAHLVLYGINEKVRSVHNIYKELILKSVQIDEDNNDSSFYRLISHGMNSFYFSDSPRENNHLRQNMARLGRSGVNIIFTDLIDQCKYNINNRIYNSKNSKLRIGYITDFLYQHSVGWLVRWTLQHHTLDLFDVYTYSTRNPEDKLHNRLIEIHGDKIRHIDYPIHNIINAIQDDKIDILVDLGSLTEFTTCVVTAIKPAPLQITWLGTDASQISTIDYFLADRFALPDDAQDYYSEKLIKMPHCYIAVDGFERDRPSVSRTDFGIPEHGIIYLSSQGGAKRHPDNMKLQVQILNQVPNSYLLIKGMKTDEAVILQSFTELAVSLGVESDRIKIMPETLKEETHRANLKIADVILDTYPYNGATTTLEALWCEVPLVTRVGQQFAARNSYSMLMNAGITEGVAWTDEEYVAWGISLGLNRDLRDRVRWKLRQSKRTSPLWDARQFTRDLETVYQQVWECYLTERTFTISHSRTIVNPTS